MKTGLLEKMLTRRYGRPIPCIRDGLAAKSWNYAHPGDEALLYMGMKWQGLPGLRFASLRDIYGASFGGILIKNTLRAAVLLPQQLRYVWGIDELRIRPEVQYALTLDPAVDYFMEKNNVLFYGIKKGELYCYDSDFEEFDSLGPIEQALETIMDDLIDARKAVRKP